MTDIGETAMARLALLGLPQDDNSTFLRGPALAPPLIRQALVSPSANMFAETGTDLGVAGLWQDAGDLPLSGLSGQAAHDAIHDGVSAVLARGQAVISLGGDHSVAYPLLKAHAKKHGPVALVQFDAHCDTWPDDGTRFDHGTMFARAAAEGIIDVKRSTQVGLRTYNSSDHGFEILTSPWVHRNGMDAAIDIVRDRAGDAPVYLSFDIDGLDPAFAPGTGTPVIGGLASWQGLEFVRGLEPLRLIGMDLVEVAPAYDHAEITAIAAASIAYDWMAVVAKQRGAVPHPVGRT